MLSGSSDGSGILAASSSTGRTRDVLLEGGLDLHPNGIGFARDLGILAFAAGPSRSHQRDEEVARLERVVDMPAEVAAKRDVVEVNEQAFLA
jgi:hypothetical protein